MEMYEKDDDEQRASRKRKTDHPKRVPEDPNLSDLMYKLSQVFLDHFKNIYKDDPPFPPNVLFDERHLI